MELIRITGRVVDCTLSKQDLKDYDVTYKDIAERSPKVFNMMKDVIGQAVKLMDVAANNIGFSTVFGFCNDTLSITIEARDIEDIEKEGGFPIQLDMDNNNADPEPKEEKECYACSISFTSLNEAISSCKKFGLNSEKFSEIESILYKEEKRFVLLVNGKDKSQIFYIAMRMREFGNIEKRNNLYKDYVIENKEIVIKKKAISALASL